MTETIPWLEKRLELITVPQGLENTCVEGLDRFKPIGQWALLKLASLRWLTTLYVDIIDSELRKGHIEKMYYVDLFSGSGINRIAGSSVRCYGSPLIINELQRKKNKYFTKMFLNEKNKEKAQALESCLAANQATECEVTHKDANLRLKEIESELHEKSHSLIFVDPYSTAFSWKSMESILALNSDIFFLFNTTQMPRAITRASNPDGQPMRFFKDFNKVKEVYQDPYKTQEGTSAIFDEYKQDVLDARGVETLMDSIRINGGGYDMLFVTRFTSGGSPWWRAVTELKNKIESYDASSVEKTLRVLLKEQSKLTDFGG
jgi:three-Cys-motif partner protein